MVTALYAASAEFVVPVSRKRRMGARAARPEDDYQLKYSLTHQQMANWCWAAVTTSTANYFGAQPVLSQCTFASLFLGRSCCPTSLACDQPMSLTETLAKSGYLRRVAERPATGAEVVAELAAGRPVGVRIAWPGGKGHFVVISGVDTTPTGFMVNVADPWSGDSQMSIEELTTSYTLADGVWTHTYFTGRPE